VSHLLAQLGFWALLPVSAVQGLWLRRNALRLPEASGARNGVAGTGAVLHLLALGDSIIAGVGTGTMERSLPVQFAQALAGMRACSVHWRVEGENGADITDLRQRLQQLPADCGADLVLISIGVNDVTGLSSARHWRSQLDGLTDDIENRWPRAGVVFAGLPPMGCFPLPPQPLRFTLGHRAATLDAIATRVISQRPGMLHIPTEISPLEHEFCADGFHPSAESCAMWAAVLAQKAEAAKLVPVPGQL